MPSRVSLPVYMVIVLSGVTADMLDISLRPLLARVTCSTRSKVLCTRVRARSSGMFVDSLRSPASLSRASSELAAWRVVIVPSCPVNAASIIAWAPAEFSISPTIILSGRIRSAADISSG